MHLYNRCSTNTETVTLADGTVEVVQTWTTYMKWYIDASILHSWLIYESLLTIMRTANRKPRRKVLQS